MNVFLWAIIVLYILSALIQLTYLVTGHIETPTSPITRAVVIVSNLCLVAWAAYLLLQR